MKTVGIRINYSGMLVLYGRTILQRRNRPEISFFKILTLWDRAVVARKAHNLEVVGSNPSPATKSKKVLLKTQTVHIYTK